MEGKNMFESDSVDPAREALDRVLGGMKSGEQREIGLEEFKDLMESIRSEFNLGESEHKGTIGDEDAEYQYVHAEDGDVVRVTRTQ